MTTHLIQSRELFGPIDRQDELREVWKRNECVFDEFTHPEGRPTFAEMFRMCKPDRVNILCNSDIYFELAGIQWITYVYGRYTDEARANRVMALSRYDIDPEGVAMLWNNGDSQDTWIVFGGPHEVDAPYPMGVPGCDNALIHALRQAGFTVTNPSKTIRTYHLHLSQYRSYLDGGNGQGRGGAKIERVPPPYGFSHPTEL